MSAAPDVVPVHIRPMSDDPSTRERQFVWETSVKVRWPKRNGIPWAEWVDMHGPQVSGYMSDATCLVAESGGVLLGFAVVKGGVVCMLYVKAAFRGDGIGRALLGLATMRSVPLPFRAYLPTQAWRRWCEHHGFAWERVRL